MEKDRVRQTLFYEPNGEEEIINQITDAYNTGSIDKLPKKQITEGKIELL